MSETQMQHHRRRGAELAKQRKAELCALYRRLGGMGGKYPPERWTKEEVITCITEMEWARLPEDQKAPTPPLMSPPCDECGGGQNAHAHRYGGSHNYTYTHNPDVPWVRADHEPAEEQPTEANATADQEIRESIAATEMVARIVAPPGHADEAAAIVRDVMTSRAARYELLEGGTGPGVSPDQTRETPVVPLPPPALTVHVNRCTPDHTDCERE